MITLANHEKIEIMRIAGNIETYKKMVAAIIDEPQAKPKQDDPILESADTDFIRYCSSKEIKEGLERIIKALGGSTRGL